jgi:hypothetical protein
MAIWRTRRVERKDRRVERWHVNPMMEILEA